MGPLGRGCALQGTSIVRTEPLAESLARATHVAWPTVVSELFNKTGPKVTLKVSLTFHACVVESRIPLADCPAVLLAFVVLESLIRALSE